MKKNKIEELLDFLEAEPNDSFLKYALALEYVKQENYNTARSYLETILVVDPVYLAAYYQLGKILEKLEKNEDAAGIYKKGMEIALLKNNRHTYNELDQAYKLVTGTEEDY
jgi:Tfp pilus assembly protein PilF